MYTVCLIRVPTTDRKRAVNQCTVTIMEAVLLVVRFLLGLHWRDIILPVSTFVLCVYALPTTKRTFGDGSSVFPNDHLTPYPEHRHGSGRTIREIRECQHVSWNNRTYEEFNMSTSRPTSKELKYHLYRFADTEDGKRYMVGTIAYIEDPYFTFSVLEPGEKGSCDSSLYFTRRSTVLQTAKNRRFGCHLAANAGFFSVTTGQCLGNIVSDGRIVQTNNNEQNANFGIRQDGTIVVGYISDEEILNSTNPFRQLVSGVIWLVRNGTNYVNESMKQECSSHEDTGKMETFVDVISARTALGHDSQGRVVMVQVEGQTHHRG